MGRCHLADSVGSFTGSFEGSYVNASYTGYCHFEGRPVLATSVRGKAGFKLGALGACFGILGFQFFLLPSPRHYTSKQTLNHNPSVKTPCQSNLTDHCRNLAIKPYSNN